MYHKAGDGARAQRWGGVGDGGEQAGWAGGGVCVGPVQPPLTDEQWVGRATRPCRRGSRPRQTAPASCCARCQPSPWCGSRRQAPGQTPVDPRHPLRKGNWARHKGQAAHTVTAPAPHTCRNCGAQHARIPNPQTPHSYQQRPQSHKGGGGLRNVALGGGRAGWEASTASGKQGAGAQQGLPKQS